MVIKYKFLLKLKKREPVPDFRICFCSDNIECPKQNKFWRINIYVHKI